MEKPLEDPWERIRGEISRGCYVSFGDFPARVKAAFEIVSEEKTEAGVKWVCQYPGVGEFVAKCYWGCESPFGQIWESAEYMVYSRFSFDLECPVGRLRDADALISELKTIQKYEASYTDLQDNLRSGRKRR